jgi:hypothetical protein
MLAAAIQVGSLCLLVCSLKHKEWNSDSHPRRKTQNTARLYPGVAKDDAAARAGERRDILLKNRESKNGIEKTI